MADSTDSIVTLMEMFHSAVTIYRPGARYIFVVTDELMTLAFADNGGALDQQVVRKSDGPVKQHPSNPDWSPPAWDQSRLTVKALTGDPHEETPPMIWAPGPGVREIAPTPPAIAAPRPSLVEHIEVEGDPWDDVEIRTFGSDWKPVGAARGWCNRHDLLGQLLNLPVGETLSVVGSPAGDFWLRRRLVGGS